MERVCLLPQSGYKVSISVGGTSVDVTQRMSSARTGVCTPTHLNAEVWASSTMSDLRVYNNESYLVGGIGYFGFSGLYTTHQFVLNGAAATPPYFPGFWMHYKMNDPLINQLSVDSFMANSNFYPPAKAQRQCSQPLWQYFSRWPSSSFTKNVMRRSSGDPNSKCCCL